MGALSILSPITALVGKGSDHTQPIIDQLQAMVNNLTNPSAVNGGGKLTPEQLAQVRKDNPGISPEFDRASSTADKNSSAYKQKGLDSLDNYTSYWYNQMRDPKAYTLNTNADGSSVTSPQTTADDLTTKLTTAVTGAVGDLTKAQSDLVTQLQGQNTSLTGLIQGQAQQFQKSQADLLGQFQTAQSNSAKQMSDLVNQLNQSAQKAKAPNYARALTANKALNSGGLSSTMLTGSAGVAPSSLSLGFTSLLGA